MFLKIFTQGNHKKTDFLCVVVDKAFPRIKKEKTTSKIINKRTLFLKIEWFACFFALKIMNCKHN